MAIELSYNDINAEGAEAAAEATASGGSSNAISGLNSTLREVNELMDNMQQVQRKAANMQGNQQQQAQQGHIQGNQVQGNQPPANPTQSGQDVGGNTQQSSGEAESLLNDLDPEQVYKFLTDAVIKIEEDLEDGEEATMQDLEEYMIENKSDILTLIDTGKQMVLTGQAQQFIGGNNGD